QRSHGTAVIFITHDLRLAAQLCDDVVVMYAGRAVENGPARTVLSQPAHPYTRCLQLANPPMNSGLSTGLNAGRRALYVMPDQMPSLRQLQDMPGCHFAPRCPLAADECRATVPRLLEVASGHGSACFKAAGAGTISTVQAPAALAVSAERSLLEIVNLQKRYDIAGGLFGGARSINAVKSASFAIAENEFVALVGESGSGKSTIAKVLAGLEPA